MTDNIREQQVTRSLRSRLREGFKNEFATSVFANERTD
jgi:chorismate mutase